MDLNERTHPALSVSILRDDKAPAFAPAERLVKALVAQAGEQGHECRVYDTKRWGAPDLEPGLTLHVISSERLHHPKPWRFNVAVIAEDTRARPDNLEDYDAVCRVSCTEDLDAARFVLTDAETRAGDEPLSLLLTRLTERMKAAPERERMRAALEQALTVTENGPLVSVLLATHDRLEFLGDAVDSVLAQRYPNWELLVIQDGGPDVSPILEERRDPRIRLFVQPQNRGKSAALNLALEHAQGEYVACLDDDDVWLPHHLEANVRVLVTTPGVRMTHSDGHRLQRRRTASGWEVDESSRSQPYTGHVSLEDILENNSILGITVVHDRELLREAGPYDEHLETLVDFDMWRRLAALTHPCHVAEVTAEYFVWASKESRRSQMTNLGVRDFPRYLANKARVLCKPLPESVPEGLHAQWKQLRRTIRYEFLLQRGMHFLRKEHNTARALVSLKRAQGFCPPSSESRRILAIALLEAEDARASLKLLQKNLAAASHRRPADYLYTCLALLQLGQAQKVPSLLDTLEQEFSLTKDEIELASRYRALARKAAGR
ncbi:glycosyltransferase family 2 protein [Salidesulfovibrio brasiliensis]|uniref:glycosyltransferase family 2 protein n=1 Tax=Salidesulfovibrio brasiliensis TaxID=221711 RepID=UPI0006D05940|nr:glycosyltransferase [Salidesulfovibrio brasiliensis]